MATISSPGIGSGLDIKGIVAQLVELEKKPLEKIMAKAETTQSKITTFGQLKSLVDALNTAVSKLTSVSGWNAVSAASSKAEIATATAIGGTQPTNFDLKVQSLATARSTVSEGFAANAIIGSGTLKFTVAGKTTQVNIAATDKLADVASKINGSGAGVTATIMTDPSSGEQRLMLRGKETGTVNDFALEVTDNDGNLMDNSGLSRLKLEATPHQTLGPVITSGVAPGSGTLHIQVAGGAVVDVAIDSDDELAEIAQKINDADAGVTAEVEDDGMGNLRLKLTGTEGGAGKTFTVTVTDDDATNDDANGLSMLATSQATTTQTASGAIQNQAPTDAMITINGISASSSTNTFNNVVAGVTLTVSKVTEANESVTITITKDSDAAKENIKAFVEAYNAINTELNELTKYDPATGVAGLLQGDSTTLALQSALRTAVQAVFSSNENLVSGYNTLSSIGIMTERGGNLVMDEAKLSTALSNQDAMKNLFATSGVGNAQGIAARIKSVTSALLASDGFFKRKDDSLKSQLSSNQLEQERFEDKISRIEAQLNRKYSALDVQMSSLNSLSNYIQQQITTWNNAKS